MGRIVTFYNQRIRYFVRDSSRAKYLRLAVYFDGSVVVTRPIGTADGSVREFIKRRAEWVLDKLDERRHIDANLKKADVHHFRKYKDTAYRVVADKVEYWNTYFHFSYNQILIGRQKTRWGSCSEKRNLSFNYKIIFLPEKLQDYVVVHELCHLQEMNHSNNFWQLMRYALPKCDKLSRELQQLSSAKNEALVNFNSICTN